MKKLVSIVLSSIVLSITSSLQAQTIDLTPKWETDTTLKTPECVLFEPGKNVWYISCINGNPTLENKSSYISKLGPDGKVIQLKFTENLNSTKGMGILGDKLYVTEMTQVVEIALATGKILKRYPVEGAKFLNDIAVDLKNGVVYITDSGDSKVWALTNGKASVILADAPLKGPNGLLFENNQLLIGNGDGSLLSMNTTTKKVTTVAKGMGGIDGIVALGGKKYIVTEWGGKIWYIHADGTPELKLDTSKEKINSADIGYDAKTRMLLVPTFFHNTVKAYTIK
jgi:sugar lactone lactonase YvrE